MSTIALYTWIFTVLAGLLLFVIWIMEYDHSFQREAASRLPVPVIIGHALMGMGGLVLWIAYLLVDDERLAWVTVVTLGTVAMLGLIMAARWFSVYRAIADPSLTIRIAVPPERNFPVPVVIIHGILAVTTLSLVFLTALGVGGS